PIALLVMGLVLAACGGPDRDSPSARQPSPAPSMSAMPSPSVSASVAPATGTPRASLGPIDPPPLELTAVGEGLAAPIGIATGPPGWLLIQEQDGRVVALETASGATSVALDITDRVLGG